MPIATFTTSVPNDGLGTSVAGLGDPDGNTRSTLAVLARGDMGKVYFLEAEDSAADTGFTAGAQDITAVNGRIIVSNPASFFNYRVASAGDFDGDDRPDTILTDGMTTYLLFGGLTGDTTLPAAIPNQALPLMSVSGLVNLGDVDGDGVTDLGSTARVMTQSLSGATVAQSQHLVGHVFLGGDRGALAARSPQRFLAPSLIVETGKPFYAATVPDQPLFFGPLGNIDGVDAGGRARGDFAIADTLAGRSLYVFPGQNVVVNAAGDAAAGLHRYELASATLALPSPRALDLNQGGTQSLSNAYSVNGSQATRQLGDPNRVGDFNGDGFDDFLLTDAVNHYLVLGPVTLTSDIDIAARAAHLPPGNL